MTNALQVGNICTDGKGSPLRQARDRAALWLDWVRVVVNSPGDLTYSIPNLPWLLAPAIAWAGRTKAAPTVTAGAA